MPSTLACLWVWEDCNFWLHYWGHQWCSKGRSTHFNSLSWVSILWCVLIRKKSFDTLSFLAVSNDIFTTSYDNTIDVIHDLCKKEIHVQIVICEARKFMKGPWICNPIHIRYGDASDTFNTYRIHISEYSDFYWSFEICIHKDMFGMRVGYFWKLICNFKPKNLKLKGQFALSDYREAT